MGATKLDVDKWPVALLVLPRASSEEELRRAVEAVAELARRGEPFALIVDWSEVAADGFTALHRKAISERLHEAQGTLAATLVGEAAVASDTSARGIVTALRWVFAGPWPFKLFDDRQAAASWARAQLVQTDARPPARAATRSQPVTLH